METVAPVTETEKSLQKDAQSTRGRWLSEIRLYEGESRKWMEQCKKINQRYKQRQSSGEEQQRTQVRKKFNILWSNIQVLSPALYAKTPSVEVVLRDQQSSDPTGRMTSEVFQRSISYEVGEYDFDSTASNIISDYLLFGRGQGRVRYKATFGQSQEIDPTTKQPLEVVESEHALCEYVYHEDFLHSPARIWEEVRWVAFRSYMSRDELIKEFGDAGKEVSLDTSTMGAKESYEADKTPEMFKKAIVYEIWNKVDKKVYWVTSGYQKGPLRVSDDPLGLKGFFPCPRPFYATLSTDSLIPTPDYEYYRDQAIEVDDLSTRMSAITDAIRVNGAYDAACGVDLSGILKQEDGKLKAVHNWRALGNKGGLSGVMQTVDIEPLVKVLGQLYEARKSCLDEIYQITGISDIIRGQSNQYETAAAQQIKSRFGTLRLSSRQMGFQRFLRDLLALKGEIIAEKFAPETIRQISGYDFIPGATLTGPDPTWMPPPADPNIPPEQLPPQEPPPMVPDDTEFNSVIELLKSDPLRNYRVNVETDSTLAVDDDVEKEKSNEYLGAMSQFVQSFGQTLQMFPTLAPWIQEVIASTSKCYRFGRQMQDSLESSFAALVEQMSQPPPPPPPPEPDPAKMQANEIKREVAQATLALKDKHHTETIMAQKETTASQLAIQKYQIDKNVSTKVAELEVRIDEIMKQMQLEAFKFTQTQQESEKDRSLQLATAVMGHSAKEKDATEPGGSSNRGERKPGSGAGGSAGAGVTNIHIGGKKKITVKRDKSGQIAGADVEDGEEDKAESGKEEAGE